MPDTLDEALAGSSTYETNNTIVINNDLRTLTIPDDFVLGVYNDKDTHRVYFLMPKTYGEFDLSEFTVRVNFENASGEGDRYEVDDSAVSGDNIKFSWLVGRSAYLANGTVTFAVCLIKIASDGTVEKEFNTTINRVPVLEGYEAEPLSEEEINDFLTLVNNAASSASASATAAATSEKNAADSETQTQLYENSAAQSATNASKSASSALTSETNAKSSATAAATSETNAKASEEAAALSEKNAMTSTPDGFQEMATFYNTLDLYIDDDGDWAQKD